MLHKAFKSEFCLLKLLNPWLLKRSNLQVGIYMPLYDSLMKSLDGLGASGPLAAGALARMTAVMITSPLELIRTRTQAVFNPHRVAGEVLTGSHTTRMWNSLSLAAADLTTLGRVQLLWRGKPCT